MSRVDASYLRPGYDYRGRFLSYWHQIHEVKAAADCGRVLEVGVGNRFLSGYLSARGVPVTTLDLNPSLAPGVAGDVRSLPFADGSFAVVACFQVLEHLPFDAFGSTLAELGRVAGRVVLVSVPDARGFAEVDARLGSRLLTLRRVISFPRGRNRRLPADADHRWEIGRPGTPLRQVISAAPDSLRLERHYRVPGNPVHHMFRFRCAPTSHGEHPPG